ncbi:MULTISPECIES: hypothetical protein [Lentibacillus]|uniref:Uncharacterized protein n=1 Tax=Lentibacillus juripiscarius TaxID=257446 RepID=A0ABW5V4J7_9BACI|nr:hypothetical protein [Lentibacillus amyloliquefaciens]
MLYKNNNEFNKKQAEIIGRLNKEGIRVRKGKKEPLNREYSGILGYESKILKINFPK